LTFAVNFAATIAARNCVCVPILLAAFLASKLGMLCDVIDPGLGASTTIEASWNRLPCRAISVLAPVTNARNWAAFLVTRLLIRFIGWRRILALLATILGRCDLNPLPFPEDVVVRSSGAVGTAVSPFSPFAHSGFWAWFWHFWQTRWAARNNLDLAPLSAVLATIQRELGDDELPGHGSIRVRAWFAVRRAMFALARA
jgi:hypothetical protein